MEDVLNSSAGGRLTRAASLLSATSKSSTFHLALILGVFSLEQSYCDDMSLTRVYKLMDTTDSEAHQGLHYASYEGGEVVGSWFTQGEGFMDEVQVLIEHIFFMFHEVELTRVDIGQLAGAHAKVELAPYMQ
eukprot:scaffold29666_cov15-Tisochrysis_lutea.AAC.1